MASSLDVVADNPLIVKHLRSRLRPSQLLPWVVVVLSLGTLFCWIGYYTDSLGTAAFWWLAGIGFLFFVVGGSNQVTTAVGSAKESGILDFHRVSPLPASTVTLGFFVGAPIREYLLYALLLPFLYFCGRDARLDSPGFFDLAVPTVLTGWLMFALSILAALVAKRPKLASVGIVAVLLVSMWIGSGVYAGYRVSRMMGQQPETAPFGIGFFGMRLPTLAWLALYEGTATILLLLAATRKMRSEGALAYSKPEALACMATIATLALGAFWSVQDTTWVVPALLYIFVITGIVLATTVTPDSNEYTKGVRRALRAGRRRPSIWADAASSAWCVYGLAGLVALGATIATERLTIAIQNGYDINTQSIKYAQVDPGRYSYSITIAIGVFTVAYYGLGKQFFALRFGRKGEIYYRLLLFLLWFLPPFVGIAAGVTSANNQVIQSIVALSPWAGMVLSIVGLLPESEAAETVRFISLLPSIALAFVFHGLLTNQQRKIDHALRDPNLAKGPSVGTNPWNGPDSLEGKSAGPVNEVAAPT